ncbi:MAG TPA: D-aminoacyl-tRNA deacylase [Phycisphaerales bacterium]|nr:D-aminoacyl-tRNA deacylase [Phycisphaerales bacterium]
MIVVVQRVASASVEVEGAVVGEIGPGLLALCGLLTTDTDADLAWAADKLVNLRIFEDDQGRMNRSALDLKGSFLLVPNFTLAGDARKGRRPSFDNAMRPEQAGPMFERFAGLVRSAAAGCHVATGVFRAHMRVTLLNDGPVTILVDSAGKPA